MSYLLGIDVGTTRTAAAIGRSGARPSDTEIVNLGDRSSAVPSVLYIGDDGAVVVGEAAERRAVSSPDHVVREFKRRIGDPTPILVAGRPWAPEELSARLVRWVVDRAAQREGGPAVRVAVAHPASWGAHKKDRLGAAIAAQGVPVTFIAEPQAAALHYAAGERVEPGSTIAVYDLGGGTFDAAVVHKDDHGFTLLGRPEGIERLGGIDFDEVVFEHVRQGLPEAFEGLDETDPAVLSTVAAVRRECTEAKEALSSDTEVSIQVMTPAGQGSVRLHRSEFEAMIRPRVEETVDALRRAVSSAGLAPAQLSAVLLVGGSSRIPLVGQLVSEQLGRPVAVDADPKNAIAMGAALSLRPPTSSGAMPQVSPSRPGPGGQPMGAAALAGVPVPMGTGAAAPIGAGSSSYPPRPGFGEAAAAAAPAPAPPPAPIPATQWMSGSRNGPMPPAPAYPERPQFDPDDGRDFLEYADRPRGPSAARLVTIGGVAAAIAVVAAIALWPTGGSVPLEPDVQSSDPPVSAVTNPGDNTPEPEPEPEPDHGSGGAVDTGSEPTRAVPGDPEPTATQVSPTTEERPEPTTTRPTPTTQPTTTIPTTTTTPTTTASPTTIPTTGSPTSPAAASGSLPPSPALQDGVT